MSSDFEERRARLMDRHEESVDHSTRRFPLVQTLIGSVWGAAFAWSVQHFNQNYEQIKATLDADAGGKGQIAGMIFFILATLALIPLGVLRRLVSSTFRQRRGWSLILSFLLGIAAANLAARLMGAAA